MSDSEVEAASTVPAPISVSAWPADRKQYELVNEIGGGSTAKVFTAICKQNNQHVAIKVIDLEVTTADIDEIRTELMVMRTCDHPNLVQYYTSFVHSNELWIVMELMDRGSMLDIIRYKQRRVKEGVLDEVVIATVLKFVLQGLHYLHTNQKMHRDVKSGNILVNKKGEIKLADFGVSAFLGEGALDSFERSTVKGSKRKQGAVNTQRRITFVGTPCWMAPEVMEQVGYNEKADIWSLGITAIELATGYAPYSDLEALQIMTLVMNSDPPTIESVCKNRGETYASKYKGLNKFVRRCLEKDPVKRPSAAELLKSDFIKKAKDDKYLLRTLLQAVPPLTGMKASATQADEKQSRGRFVSSKLPSGWVFEEDIHPNSKPSRSASDAGSEHAMSGGEDSEGASQQPSRSESGVDQPPPPPEGAAPSSGAPSEASSTVPMEQDSAAPARKKYSFKLRIRKGDNETVNEIKFSMVYPDEKPVQIAEELVQSKLLPVLDATSFAKALRRLIDNPELKTQLFALTLDEGANPVTGELVDGKIPQNHAQLVLSKSGGRKHRGGQGHKAKAAPDASNATSTFVPVADPMQVSSSISPIVAPPQSAAVLPPSQGQPLAAAGYPAEQGGQPQVASMAGGSVPIQQGFVPQEQLLAHEQMPFQGDVQPMDTSSQPGFPESFQHQQAGAVGQDPQHLNPQHQQQAPPQVQQQAPPQHQEQAPPQHQEQAPPQQQQQAPPQQQQQAPPQHQQQAPPQHQQQAPQQHQQQAPPQQQQQLVSQQDETLQHAAGDQPTPLHHVPNPSQEHQQLPPSNGAALANVPPPSVSSSHASSSSAEDFQRACSEHRSDFV